jgi:hypothetical protein
MPFTSVADEMHRFKQGQLHSGSPKGPIVKSRKQAIAISLSQARKKKGSSNPTPNARRGPPRNPTPAPRRGPPPGQQLAQALRPSSSPMFGGGGASRRPFGGGFR